MTGGKGRPAVKRGRAGGDTRAHGRPARIPVICRCVDHIYVRMRTRSSPTALPLRNWRHLSDHAPLARESIYEMRLAWGNQIQLLENGDQFYPAVFEAIAQAQQKSFTNLYLI